MNAKPVQKHIFISYSWNDTKEKDYIYNTLRTLGAEVSVDCESIDKWGSITGFMESLPEHQFIILLLSDAYLKSMPCMIELDMVMRLEDYRERALPIVLDESLFNSEKKRECIKYWNDKKQQLINDAARVSGDIQQTYLDEFEKVKQFSKNLPDYIVTLTDMWCPKKDNAIDWIVSKIRDAGIKILDINTAYYSPQETEIKETQALNIIQIDRKNELINWYFISPINQRGAMRYDSWYTIDHWRIFSQNTTAYIAILENGLQCCSGKMIDNNANHFAVLEQKLEYPERYSAQDVTFSLDVIEFHAKEIYLQIAFMAEDNRDVQVAQKLINTDGMHCVTTRLKPQLKMLSVRIVFSSSQFESADNGFIVIKRAKLEIGSESTLHYDCPPIRHEELLRCQRYSLQIKQGIIAWPSHIGPYSMFYSIPLPCPLRLLPSIYIDKYRLQIFHGLQEKEDVEAILQWEGMQANVLHLRAFLPNRRTGEFALVAIEDTVFDAELS
jgi:hypothetical protein